jgi:hypothetical protein
MVVPAADATTRTCRSGHTVYRHNGVRVFEDDGFDGEWFACGPRSRRPAPLYSSEAGYGVLNLVGRSGDKVLFSGEGGEEQTTVGYFDARASRARSDDLAGEVSSGRWTITGFAPGGPGALRRERILTKVRDGVSALAFSADGTRVDRAGAERSATAP